MTAPDPGLTDLIAAHWYNTSTCMCTCGWSTRHLPESDDDTRIGILVARHLALVVEQHTNGRIASDLGADPQDYEIAWAAKLRWQARAEKAEEEVRRLKSKLQKGSRDG